MIISKSHSLMRTVGLAGSLIAGAYAADKPNVIVVVCDDAGYADWGFMDEFTGNTSVVPTPNLDALRNRGTLFTSAYTGMVSSPSRGAITTGCYQNRFGYEFNIKNSNGSTSRDGHYNSTKLAFEHFRPLGYTTGAIGKWHIGCGADNAENIDLGNNRPNRQGVDEFFGIWQGSRNYTLGGAGDSANDIDALRETFADADGNITDETVLEKLTDLSGTVNKPSPSKFSDSDQDVWKGMNVTTAFGRGAMNFIDRHYQDADPFFLYVAYTAPHSPMHNSPDFDDPRIASLSGKRKQYASMVLTMDKEIGRMLDQLEDPNDDGNNSDSIVDNTLIVFINDNGGEDGNGSVNTPLRDYKFSPYEGGIRIPMIMAGPGIPEGVTYDKVVHSIDITPTCLAATGETIPDGFDGVNLLPYLGDNPPEGHPHEFTVVRQGTKMGLRKGDWKLVKKSGTDFQLYNLSTDISESTDLSASEPEKLAELKRHLTDMEVQWEKPRHDGYREGAVNQNNGFIANPTAPIVEPNFDANLIIIGGDTLNGNFNADTSTTDKRTFSDTPNWENVGSGSQGDTATRIDNPSSEGDPRNAIINEATNRIHGIDTGHTLTTGEVFATTYDWINMSNCPALTVSLFVTDDDTISGTQTILESLNSTSASSSNYVTNQTIFSPIAAEYEGKRLFVMFNARDNDNNGFARLDNFVLERGTISQPEGTPSTSFKWSDSNKWLNGDTNSQMSIKEWDSYPGAYFEFPSKPYNYTSENNKSRMVGLDYMLNKISFTGDDDTSTTLEGLPLLFVNDLDGNAPKIELDRTAGNVTIKTDLVLYNDLLITGNGGAEFTIDANITEYNSGVKIIKSGDSTLLINKDASYTGETTVNGGSLTVAPSVTLASPVAMAADTVLKGNGTISGSVTVTGKVAPGQSIGTLTVESLDLDGSLENEIDGSTTDKLVVTNDLDITGATLDILDISAAQSGLSGTYIIVSYGTLTGEFATINGLPAGYIIDYSYNGNNIALVDTTTGYGSTLNSKFYPFANISFGSNGTDNQALGVFNILSEDETNTIISHNITSDADGTVYKDHTSTTYANSITRGQNYALKLANKSGGKRTWGVHGWADWNGDGDFDDTNEKIISKQIKTGGGYTNLKEIFTVPANAVNNVLIRVRTFKATGDAITENDDAWGDVSSTYFTGVRDFTVKVDGLTPAVGLEVVQTGNILSWKVEDEIDVKEYQIVVNGKVVAVVKAKGLSSYTVTLDSDDEATLVVVDNSGFSQSFVPQDGNEKTTVYDLEQGWNLIAITSENADLSTLKSETGGVIWGWNENSYEAIDSAEPTDAVWVYASTAKEVRVTGRKSDAEIVLETGWNMVGPTESDTKIPRKSHTIYSWSDKYDAVTDKTETLIEGKGYWIFAL